MPEQKLPKRTYRVSLSPAACAVDLGDGSERGEYVSQDYILRRLGRPHRSVNLMYCYYPLDEGWPGRASVAFERADDFAWAYPYDDYFPYEGGPDGSTEGEPFRQMRDIRRHGQDVTLSLAIDCAVGDEHLQMIARELAPFGRMRLRINHECDGGWFAFNKRYSHREIAEFFIHFNAILKREAPEVRTISCFGTVDPETGRLKHEDGLAPMLAHADVWSVDKYLFLHYAWPFNVCEAGQLGKGYSHDGLDYVWKELRRIYGIFVERTGREGPLEICEFNADGDVPGGREHQSRELAKFYRRVRSKRPAFLKGITYYQFRDRGRLGLEQEDPNDPGVGVPAAFMAEYRRIIRDPHFSPGERWTALRPGEGLAMEWRAADDSDGLGWRVPLKGRPSFFELRFGKEPNLMVRAGDEWFYKRPGVEWVDATSAVARAKKGGTLKVAVFAPPSDGTNPASGSGWAGACRSRLQCPPVIRVRYPR